MNSPELVLSLFPGIGLLDRQFRNAGFCVCEAPDLVVVVMSVSLPASQAVSMASLPARHARDSALPMPIEKTTVIPAWSTPVRCCERQFESSPNVDRNGS